MAAPNSTPRSVTRFDTEPVLPAHIRGHLARLDERITAAQTGAAIKADALEILQDLGDDLVEYLASLAHKARGFNGLGGLEIAEAVARQASASR